MQLNTVLIIGYVWPEPNSSAAGSRMLDLIHFFKKRSARVVFATPAQDSPHKVDLNALQIETKSISLNCSSFDGFCKALDPELVLFDRFMMEEQFGWRVTKICPDAIKVLDTEDLHCLRYCRHQHFKKTGKLLLDPSLSDLNSDHAQRELAAIWRSDLSLIISSKEMEILIEQFKVDPELLHHSPLWIDKIPLERTFEERNHFVTVGNFRHAPNWDSVLWLNSEIWPGIRKHLPEAELHIYGAYPPPKATALNHPQKGFYIKGWADDALEVLNLAKVCIAPLRFGAGIKGKFLDSLHAGTPSITTSIGAEGMFQHKPWPGAIGNTREEIIESAIELYTNKTSWQASLNNTDTLLAQHQSTLWAEKLATSLANLKDNLAEHRLNNFIGTMLNHHTLKSTQYMSQWIEAKNKLATE